MTDTGSESLDNPPANDNLPAKKTDMRADDDAERSDEKERR